MSHTLKLITHKAAQKSKQSLKRTVLCSVPHFHESNMKKGVSHGSAQPKRNKYWNIQLLHVLIRRLIHFCPSIHLFNPSINIFSFIDCGREFAYEVVSFRP